MSPDDELPSHAGEGTGFRVYSPVAVRPGVWTSFLVYLYSGDAEGVDADSAHRLGSSRPSYSTEEGAARVAIARGAEMTVVPTIPGCLFNPRQQRIHWLEEIHAVEFRLRASPDVTGYATERRLRGYVRIYVGPLLVGEIPTSIVASQKIPFEQVRPSEGAIVRPFSRVFVSYCHDDYRIVTLLQQAYELVRLDYIRDVTALRAGDRWNSRILDEIDRADRFQLCWSAAASRSLYVEQEWRHALGIQGAKEDLFICRFYWQKPMPLPPSELSDLHFAYLRSRVFLTSFVRDSFFTVISPIKMLRLLMFRLKEKCSMATDTKIAFHTPPRAALIPPVNLLLRRLTSVVARRQQPRCSATLKTLGTAARIRTALQHFVRTLCHDLSAVERAVVESWSNGPVEGQVNRLKTIKRQMSRGTEFGSPLLLGFCLTFVQIAVHKIR